MKLFVYLLLVALILVVVVVGCLHRTNQSVTCRQYHDRLRKFVYVCARTVFFRMQIR